MTVRELMRILVEKDPDAKVLHETRDNYGDYQDREVEHVEDRNDFDTPPPILRVVLS